MQRLAAPIIAHSTLTAISNLFRQLRKSYKQHNKLHNDKSRDSRRQHTLTTLPHNYRTTKNANVPVSILCTVRLCTSAIQGGPNCAKSPGLNGVLPGIASEFSSSPTKTAITITQKKRRKKEKTSNGSKSKAQNNENGPQTVRQYTLTENNNY